MRAFDGGGQLDCEMLRMLAHQGSQPYGAPECGFGGVLDVFIRATAEDRVWHSIYQESVHACVRVTVDLRGKDSPSYHEQDCGESLSRLTGGSTVISLSELD